MAAVTVVERGQSVEGNRRKRYCLISGATGDTLDVGWGTIDMVQLEPSTITAYSVAPIASNPGSRITFTASGPFTTVDCVVVGR